MERLGSGPSGLPSKRLFDLCRQRNWYKVVRLCQTDPLDAQYVGDEGLSLHAACRRQPTVQAVQALSTAFPSATSQPNADGELPLHVACRFNASISVIRYLLKQNPDSALASPSVVATLYNARESTETNMKTNNNAVLWHARKVDIQPINYATIFWQKIQVLLEAVAQQRQIAQSQSTHVLFILHAAVSLDCCPDEVLEYCFHTHPKQVFMCDERGRLPLHIAVANAVRPEGDSVLRKLQLKRERSIVQQLLERFPQAASRVDPNEAPGRFPLHTALANGHEWHGGVNDLFQQFPDCAGLQDPANGLYPFQASAHDLDTVYHLLTCMPSILMNARSDARDERKELLPVDALPLSSLSAAVCMLKNVTETMALIKPCQGCKNDASIVGQPLANNSDAPVPKVDVECSPLEAPTRPRQNSPTHPRPTKTLQAAPATGSKPKAGPARVGKKTIRSSRKDCKPVITSPSAVPNERGASADQGKDLLHVATLPHPSASTQACLPKNVPDTKVLIQPKKESRNVESVVGLLLAQPSDAPQPKADVDCASQVAQARSRPKSTPHRYKATALQAGRTSETEPKASCPRVDTTVIRSDNADCKPVATLHDAKEPASQSKMIPGGINDSIAVALPQPSPSLSAGVADSRRCELREKRRGFLDRFKVGLLPSNTVQTDTDCSIIPSAGDEDLLAKRGHDSAEDTASTDDEGDCSESSESELPRAQQCGPKHSTRYTAAYYKYKAMISAAWESSRYPWSASSSARSRLSHPLIDAKHARHETQQLTRT
jgi:Ankyrin repeat